MSPTRPSDPGHSGPAGLEKAPTGIAGFDEITYGGLPRGRPTLVCGTAGCGKTLFAMEFLVRGASQFGEPGVFVAFEETAEELTANVASLGFDLDEMTRKQQLLLDHVHVERSEIEETGEYSLDGLFIRLQWAVDQIGAKRVVLDTLESLFSGFTNTAILRAELRRLFRWLKDRGLTAVITGERGEGQLTRQGLEEYVSDCVILLDHRVIEQQATRRLRIVKYRGSHHGTNEYPFLIDEHGFSVLPVTSLALEHEVSSETVSTGVPGLDEMLGTGGVYRGSSVLLSGTAGTGKTTLASAFLDAACRRGERALMLAYEESPAQIVRNMRSVGIDLQPWIDRHLLHIHATRPFSHGLEMHLVTVHKLIRDLQPRAVVMDPISNLLQVGSTMESRAMMVRVIDFLKSRGVTALYTNLTAANGSLERTELGVSSLIDTWLLVRQLEVNGERNRTLFVLKSRGMSHSNQVREFLITGRGLALRDAYLGTNGVLTGSARVAQEAQDREEEVRRAAESRREAARQVATRRALEAQIAQLEAELAAAEQDSTRIASDEADRLRAARESVAAMARSRGVENRETNGSLS